MGPSKKDFSNIADPTATFFSNNDKKTTVNTDQEQQEQEKKAKKKKETRSKRINVLIRPSLFEDLRRISVMSEISVNKQIESILENYVNSAEGQQALSLYDAVQNFKDTVKQRGE